MVKYDLLKDREVMTGLTSGAAESRSGGLAFFERAGSRFEGTPAGFQLTKRGAFASLFFDGNVGIGLLPRGRRVLGHRNARRAFAQP